MPKEYIKDSSSGQIVATLDNSGKVLEVIEPKLDRRSLVGTNTYSGPVAVVRIPEDIPYPSGRLWVSSRLSVIDAGHGDTQKSRNTLLNHLGKVFHKTRRK